MFESTMDLQYCGRHQLAPSARITALVVVEQVVESRTDFEYCGNGHMAWNRSATLLQQAMFVE